MRLVLAFTAACLMFVVAENSMAAVTCGIYAGGYSAQGDLLRVPISRGYSSVLSQGSGTGETLNECVLGLDAVAMAREVCSREYLTKPKSSARRAFMSRGVIRVNRGGSPFGYGNQVIHSEPISCEYFR